MRSCAPFGAGFVFLGMKMATNNSGQGRESDAIARATYSRFMTISKWAVIFVVTVLALMALFLV